MEWSSGVESTQTILVWPQRAATRPAWGCGVWRRPQDRLVLVTAFLESGFLSPAQHTRIPHSHRLTSSIVGLEHTYRSRGIPGAQPQAPGNFGSGRQGK